MAEINEHSRPLKLERTRILIACGKFSYRSVMNLEHRNSDEWLGSRNIPCRRGSFPRNIAWTAIVLASLIGGAPACGAADGRRDPPDQPFRRAPMAESSRSIVIPLATNLHWAFDAQLLRTHTVWAGPGLNLRGPPYTAEKSPFLCDIVGTV